LEPAIIGDDSWNFCSVTSKNKFSCYGALTLKLCTNTFFQPRRTGILPGKIL